MISIGYVNPYREVIVMRHTILSVFVTVFSLATVSLLAADASAVCGDGVIDPGECCDDGNTVSGDGCNGDCSCPNDHLKCYKVTDPLALKGIVDLNSPQFGLEAGCTIKKATKFCVPATKTVKSAHVGKTTIVPAPIGGRELSDDYICYSISCPKPVPPDTAVIDQFGVRTLSKFKAFELCGPARKCAPDPGQQSWSVAIEQNPMVTDCGNTTNIPVAAASDCTSATAASQALLATLLQTPNCLGGGCPAGFAITQLVSSCTEDPYIRPNGSPAIRWQMQWTWNCVCG
jgi:cysteine-rich repeat protein